MNVMAKQANLVPVSFLSTSTYSLQIKHIGWVFDFDICQARQG